MKIVSIVGVTAKKRGRGRPKKGPIDLQAERARVAKTIQERAANRLGIDDINVEEFCERLDKVSHRNKLTKEEVDELRETSNALYQKFLETQWEMEELRNERYIGAARNAAIDKALTDPDFQPSSFKPMSWEEWCKEHHLRPENGKRKPGPLKNKPKAIWDIRAGEKGTATEPGKAIDPQVFEQQWMDAQVQKLKEEDRFPKGKRMRKTEAQLPKRHTQQNFWR